MAAETDSRCDGNVRNLAHYFEKLAGSSPPDTRESSGFVNRQGCVGSAGSGAYTPVSFMGQSDFGGPAGRGGTSVKKGQCVPCNECSKSHPPYSVCPYLPCNICFKVHPDSHLCPYLDHLPKGATFSKGYEILCRFGCENFNEDKWACGYCGHSMPVLSPKFCDICNVAYEHSVYDCPKDIDLAAKYKSTRDSIWASPRICGDMKQSNDPVYVPESSSYTITSLPTAPSWGVCGDVKQSKDPFYFPEPSSRMTSSLTAPSSWVCGDRTEGKDTNIDTPCWKAVSWTI